PEEVRLLQLVSSRRSSTLAPDDAPGMFPSPMTLGLPGGAATTGAARAGEREAEDSLGRAIMWLTAFGGVVVADDLEQYVPDILGGGRLARRLNRDLFAGWGGPRKAVARIKKEIDGFEASLPLAQ